MWQVWQRRDSFAGFQAVHAVPGQAVLAVQGQAVLAVQGQAVQGQAVLAVQGRAVQGQAVLAVQGQAVLAVQGRVLQAVQGRAVHGQGQQPDWQRMHSMPKCFPRWQPQELCAEDSVAVASRQSGTVLVTAVRQSALHMAAVHC